MKNRPECYCLGPVLFFGVIAKCALFVEHLRSPGRQGRLWKVRGFNLLVSEVCFLYRMESSGTLTLRISLESLLNCPCSSRDQNTPAGRGRSLPTTCLHFLVHTVVPEMAITRYQLQLTGKSDGSVGQNIPWLRLLSVVWLSGTTVLTHLTSWLLGSLLLLCLGSLCFSTPCLTCWILFSFYFWPWVTVFTHIVVSCFLNVGDLGASIPRLQTGGPRAKSDLQLSTAGVYLHSICVS